MQLNAAGALAPVEFYGPASCEEWAQCYQVWMTGMIGFKAIRLGTALAYLAFIRRYSARYSPSVWHIIYQADVRCRRELLERIHRTVLA